MPLNISTEQKIARIPFTNFCIQKNENKWLKFGLHFFFIPPVYLLCNKNHYLSCFYIRPLTKSQFLHSKTKMGFIHISFWLPSVRNGMMSCGVLSPPRKLLLLVLFFFLSEDSGTTGEKKIIERIVEMRKFMSLK